jgi:hypothetical protein
MSKILKVIVSFAAILVSDFGSLVCDFLFSGVQFCVFLLSGVRDFVFFDAISCVNDCFFQQSNHPNVMFLLQ